MYKKIILRQANWVPLATLKLRNLQLPHYIIPIKNFFVVK